MIGGSISMTGKNQTVTKQYNQQTVESLHNNNFNKGITESLVENKQMMNENNKRHFLK
jgi:hypothetical protein